VSLYSQFEQSKSEIADSLRPTFEIFPFFGGEPETGRDQHCVVWDAVSLNLF
jgi:hypothetical protein